MRPFRALIALAACLPSVTFALATVTDDVGFSESFSRPPVRVVSLSPGATEILFELGAESRLVAVSQYCDYPPAARDLPQVGDFANPSMEAILARDPDLVIATGGPQRELILRLRASGVPTVVLYPRGLEDVFGNVRMLGRIMGLEARAERLDKRLRARVDRLKMKAHRLSAQHRPVVYFEISAQPAMAAGEGSYPGQLIELAGGENVAKGATGNYPAISTERIISADPDVIIVSHTKKPAEARKLVAGRPGWENISAVRSGRIYSDLDMDILLRPGPRLVDGLELLIARLYGAP